ncbi:hypothetical protein RVR_4515 [Actinacidiphila reveromycinica]|uniref:Uncharacterized protein n=1 Tax=Actinacidiphila reveromycinica TaxID=659352 RepID=A0A7U3UT86_9ACTN|nr:hypothetical protein [Streptomyces sp. SN-593]BBA98362.1 hypothetical protein RVR_4515 [Streptomyces sp. SN-593]
MRYYVNDNGGWLTVSGDLGPFGTVPDGYREVTEEEYNQAAGTVVLELPKDPPADDEPGDGGQAVAEPAKAKRAKSK